MLGGRLIEGVLLGAFEAKGAVLEGARARIHSIRPAPPHKTPAELEAARTPFSMWDPSELMIVSPETRTGKVAGTQRLRLHASAPRGVDRFKLRDYFELLEKAA